MELLKFVIKLFNAIILILYGFIIVKLFNQIADIDEDISKIKRAIIKQYVEIKIHKNRGD